MTVRKTAGDNSGAGTRAPLAIVGYSEVDSAQSVPGFFGATFVLSREPTSFEVRVAEQIGIDLYENEREFEDLDIEVSRVATIVEHLDKQLNEIEAAAAVFEADSISKRRAIDALKAAGLEHIE